MQSTQAQDNWRALKEIARRHFSRVRAENPGWTVERLFAAMELPATALLSELAVQAGFKHEVEPTSTEMCAVLLQRLNGVLSAEVISKNTGVSLPKVQGILQSRSAGYGRAPYGIAPYGGNRAVSDGKSAVRRRTTIKGQLSYRGHRYSLAGC